MNKILNITEEQFQKIISESESKKLSIVDCWAEWCNPCKQLLLNLEELKNVFINTVNFYKINVDNSPTIIKLYNIQSIPTLLFFKENSLIEKKTGLLSKEEIKQIINNYVL